MLRSSTLWAAAVLIETAAARATVSEVAFPLDLVATEASVEGLRYVADSARIGDLAELEQVTLVAVALPSGRMVDLDLTRIRTERMGFRFYVDGAESGDLLAGLDLTVWKGSVRGVAESDVMLSFSQVGSQGWIHVGAELVHVMPRPNASGDWRSGDVLLVTEEALNRRGMKLDSTCATGEPMRAAVTLPAPPQSGSQSLLGPGCTTRECRISLTSDYQYFQKFNDLAAQTAYTATLWSFISDRFELQADTLLTFPYVAFYTTAADPWVAQDSGGTCQDVLYEFQAAWVGNVPNGGRLGHLMSGANLGCGVAWMNVLCNGTYNFSVSGNLDAAVNFPVVQSPSNWDFYVCAHEVGHNFGANHTHAYCPPVDQCPPSQYFGQCQTQQLCSSAGTIMSYCHLCPGGVANITTYFDPVSEQYMTAFAEACLPLLAEITGSAPPVLSPATLTPVTATISGTPVGNVQLFWRATPSQPFAAIDMSHQGGGVWSASLPGFGCSESPEFYYAFTDSFCGTIAYPLGASGAPLTANVATLVATFSDDFETDLGWTATNAGAATGDWERGVPVNVANWNFDPTSDGDGSGSCWVTANSAADVDFGAVLLQSPLLDLTASDVVVEYLYFLCMPFPDGIDAMIVRISANGTNGPWIEIARHNTDGGLTWHLNSIDRAELLAAGVTPTANMRLRFRVQDIGGDGVVEAGLDGFRVSAASCTVIGANYCTPNVNSSGGAALVTALGSNSIAANDLVLTAAPLPASSNGLFFFGATATSVPFGNGVRCVASPTIRLPLGVVSGGQLTAAIDNSTPPASPHLAAGTTWNFQAWFRDSAAGGSNYDLSDGYRITFTP